MLTPITVIVISEDRIFREALEASLSRREGLEVISGREGANGGGAAVVLIDAGFDPEAALARTWQSHEEWPDSEVIAVGFDQEDESVVDFIEAGARGYVLKGTSPDDLTEVIRSVHQGRVSCSPQVVSSVLARINALSQLRTEEVAPREVEPLTVREKEILELMAAGLGNKEIARRLRITVRTVKNHVHKVLEKFQVHRRREAVRLAYDLGLLPEPHEVPRPERVVPRDGRNDLDYL
ncbi:MAG TPA: response regulator transcription factor [Thermoanaerobaculia bacterium]|nr:response regulator transcription factor [Thermoanaerobaculia bacterium]